MSTSVPRPRVLAIGVLAASGLLAACGTPGARLPVDVSPAPRRVAAVEMGEEIGRLLSPDPAVSEAASRRLMALDEAGRDALVAYHEGSLTHERDVRLLNVLDEHHALPEMPVEETLDFLLWKAQQPGRFYAMKAQSRLMDFGRSHPDALLARLERGGATFEILAIVLAANGRREAVTPLLERYRRTGDPRERAVAAESLARLTGGQVRPRLAGTPEEIATDAAAVDAWYAEQGGTGDAAASGEGSTP
jgi:hypothetical protein